VRLLAHATEPSVLIKCYEDLVAACAGNYKGRGMALPPSKCGPVRPPMPRTSERLDQWPLDARKGRWVSRNLGATPTTSHSRLGVPSADFRFAPAQAKVSSTAAPFAPGRLGSALSEWA
jgi:hypothetical protein